MVWAPQLRLVRSIDAGKSWQSVKGPAHGDHHDVWIDPLNPRRIFDGNDGGVSLSIDAGATWVSPPLPTPQFYNIDVDDRLPYYVGGTIQDQSTASGPAYVLRPGGAPGLGDFYYVGGGESGDLVFDRGAPGNIYAGGYSGYITHYQENTGNVRDISLYPRNFSGIPGQQAQVPVPVDRTDRALHRTIRRSSTRRQRVDPHHRPRGALGRHQPRPDAQRQVEAAMDGRADHR